MELPEAVFVYGTLKQGERNFAVSRRAGWVRSEPAYIEGFQLFHIPQRERLLYSYSAVVRGLGRGAVVCRPQPAGGGVSHSRYAANLALVLLDQLEDEGREYLRSPTTAYLHNQAEKPCAAWVYAYPSLQMCKGSGASGCQRGSGVNKSSQRGKLPVFL